MHLVYYDEAGDDGYPIYFSELFVLTSIYMDADNWKDNFNQFYEYRRNLKETYGLPIKTEFHAKYFITDKNPFRQFKWSPLDVKNILFDITSYISYLNKRIS